MKHIIKGPEPKDLPNWFNNQPVDESGRRLNCSYEHDMPSDVKAAVKQNLLKEQGWLCCYTGIRISEEKSHIEHFKPRSKFKENHEDIDYQNMLAAYPKSNCPFGAKARENWYDSQLLVDPLKKQCEGRFHFDQSGRIRAKDSNDLAAKETIKRLHLDHEELNDYRKQAIEEVLFPDHQRLSEAALHRIVAKYCDRDKKQQFPSFCFVIVQVAQQLLHKIEKERKRKQAIRSQKAKR